MKRIAGWIVLAVICGGFVAATCYHNWEKGLAVIAAALVLSAAIVWAIGAVVEG